MIGPAGFTDLQFVSSDGFETWPEAAREPFMKTRDTSQPTGRRLELLSPNIFSYYNQIST